MILTHKKDEKLNYNFKHSLFLQCTFSQTLKRDLKLFYSQDFWHLWLQEELDGKGQNAILQQQMVHLSPNVLGQYQSNNLSLWSESVALAQRRSSESTMNM